MENLENLENMNALQSTEKSPSWESHPQPSFNEATVSVMVRDGGQTFNVQQRRHRITSVNIQSPTTSALMLAPKTRPCGFYMRLSSPPAERIPRSSKRRHRRCCCYFQIHDAFRPNAPPLLSHWYSSARLSAQETPEVRQPQF